MKGLVHIYTGDGKGKTTAALGLGLRAVGRGFKVLMVQFLKGADTGEIHSIQKLSPDFVLHRGTELKKFTWKMTDEEKKQAAKEQAKSLEYAEKELKSGNWDMVILDEVLGAISSGMLELNDVLRIVREKPEKPELILTGRGAPAELIELADYVSEIKAVKHPMEKGVPARIGIES